MALRSIAFGALFALASLGSNLGSAEPKRGATAPDGVTATFSIVAVDPETGECGAAVASKYPGAGRVVAYTRPGVGAFCTQHWHNPKFAVKALDLLGEGKLPEEILGDLLRDDQHRDKRQLALIDLVGRAANRNPANPDEGSDYCAAMAGRNFACQGNTLARREVLTEMARAFEQTKGSLSDRLMAALVAGDCAGGDHRGRLAAGIRVSKRDVEGYWLELQIDRSDDAVVDLLREYAALEHAAKGSWRGGQLPFEHPCSTRPLLKKK